MTLFNTPLLTPLLRFLARLGLRLSGWQLDQGEHDRPAAPCVLIGAPHTSSLDFLLMVAAALDLGLCPRWFGKHTLFRFPFGAPMRWMGGIAIDRTRNHNTVEAVVEKFTRDPQLMLILSPEGTRSRVKRWRSGFYHIARLAKVPVVLVGLDGSHKTLRLLGQIQPDREDPKGVENAIEEIRRQYFGDLQGINPDKS